MCLDIPIYEWSGGVSILEVGRCEVLTSVELVCGQGM